MNNEQINNSKNRNFLRLSVILNIVLGGIIVFSLILGFQNITEFSKTAILKNYLVNDFYGNIPSDEEFAEYQLKGLVGALNDPYSEYLGSKDIEELNSQLNRQYEGVGLEFDFSTPKLYIVKSVLGDSPAKNAGILPKDILLEINSEKVDNLTPTEIINKIKGDKGTKVKLNFSRGDEILEFDLERSKIQGSIVDFELINDISIAVLDINSFGTDLVKKTKPFLKEIKDKNIKNLIVDFRQNGGGLLNEAVELCSYFVSTNTPVLQEKYKNKTEELKSLNTDFKLEDLNIVVLVDENSASASEITAAFLREQANAKVLGKKSYGKGTVQQIFPIGFNNELKLTVAEWLSSKGQKIDKIGVIPDVDREINNYEELIDQF
jgi:carboxyl-terminal processing protease